MNLFEATAKLTIDTSEFIKGLKNAQSENKKSLEQYRKDVMNLAQQYKNSGMDMSEAMKKAYSETDKSLYNLGKDADSSGNKVKSFGDVFKVVHEKASSAFSGIKSFAETAGNGISVFGDVLKANLVSDALEKGAENIISVFQKISSAATGFVKDSVSAGMNFDTAMSQVAATMGKSVDEIQNLRDFAKQMGATTKYSATESAEALNYMALAGYDAETSMAMLPNVMNLASAGAFDLARASDMITDTQTAFGLVLEDGSADIERTTQLVDEMAKAASTGNTSVEQLGDAFLTVGGLAKELNGGFVTLSDGSTASVDGIQELEIALTAMANAGVKGSEAGTHMRNMLMKLSAPTQDAKDLFEKLGVSAFEANGDMKSLREIFSSLQTAFTNMGNQQEKLEAISEIFNARDTASAQALLAAVEEGWDSIGEAILDAEGAAGRMSATQIKNLEGWKTMLASAKEGFQISLSDMIKPMLTEFVKLGAESFQVLTDAVNSHGISGISDAVANIMKNGSRTIRINAPKLLKLGTRIISEIQQGIAKGIPQTTQNLKELFNAFSTTLKTQLPKIAKNGAKIMTEFRRSLSQNIPVIFPAVTEIILSVTDGLTKPDMISEFVDSGIDLLTGLAEGLGSSASVLAERVPDIIDNLKQGFSDNKDKIKGAGETILTAFSDDLKGFSFSDAVDNIVSGLSSALDSEEWKDVKENISSGIQNIDFAEITSNLSKLIIGVTDATGKVVDGVDWDIIGGAIGEAMNGVDWYGILDSAFKLAVTTIKNAPELLDGLANTITFETANQIITIGGGAIIAKSLVTGMGAKLTSLLSAEAGGAVAGFFAGLPEVAIAALGGWTLGSVIVDALGVDTIIEANEWWLQYWYAGLDDTKESLSQGWENFKDAMYNIFVAPWEQAATYFNDFVDDIKIGYGVLKDAFDWLEQKGAAIYDFMHPSGMSTKEVIIDTFLPDTVPAQEWGKDLNDNMAKGIDDNAYLVENSSASLAQKIRNFLGFSEPEEGALSDFHTFAPDMLQLFADGIKDNSYLVENNIISLTDKIKNKISSVVDSAFNWGWDMLINFNNGIIEAFDSVIQTVANVASSIKSYLGFSEPEKGALSDFHTYAPDMMQLFAQGIKENQNLVITQAETLSNNLANAIQPPANNPFQIAVESEFNGFILPEIPDFQNQEYTVTFLDNLDELIQKTKEFIPSEKIPELALTADTSIIDKIKKLVESPLVVSVQLSDSLEKLNSMFTDVSLESHEMNAVHPYTNGYTKQIDDIKNSYSTTNYYNNIENNSYSPSRNYTNESNGNSITVQNLTINVPGFNIESPSDMNRLGNALKDTIIEILDVQEVHDNRDLGGIGWQI